MRDSPSGFQTDHGNVSVGIADLQGSGGIFTTRKGHRAGESSADDHLLIIRTGHRYDRFPQRAFETALERCRRFLRINDGLATTRVIDFPAVAPTFQG